MNRRGRKPTPLHIVDGVPHKDCRRCLSRRPLERFNKKGNTCKPCQRVLDRERVARELASPNAEKFWPLVDRRDPVDCWPWLGATHTCNTEYTPMTYGSFGSVNAHRIAFILGNGHQPATGNVVRHTCDNPMCCNPSHLEEGTRGDNQRDMQVRLRSGVLGEKNPKAKLTTEQVLEIRASTENDKALGEKYDVWPTTIYQARAGRKWRNLPGANPGFYGKRKLTLEQVRSLRARHGAGENCKALGKDFGISQCFAWQVANGRAYKSFV